MKKMSMHLAAVWAVLGALCVARAAEDNPYAKAKVGDWVEYTTTMAMQGQNIENSMRKEVIKKTATEVTLEVATQTKIAGLDENAAKMMRPMKHTVVIQLNQKFTPGRPEGAGQDIEIKELGTGAETLTVAGKGLETKWVEVEWSNKMMKCKTKSWLSKDIPLDGVVKATSELPQGTTTMELKNFGFGK